MSDHGPRKIGLVGGLSPESTVHYYEIICREYNRHAGGLNFPPLTIESLNLQQLVSLFQVNDWNGVAAILLDALSRLRDAGAEFAAILANTPHNAYELIEEASLLPIVTIMDATTNALVQDGRGLVALLGTQATMEYGFFQRHFRSHGIESLVPNSSQRGELDRIIWEELAHARVTPESQNAARSMISELIDQGADSVVLACTELPMLIEPGDSSCPLYDTTRLHADAILHYALHGPLGTP